jgi:hypothetical protein
VPEPILAEEELMSSPVSPDLKPYLAEIEAGDLERSRKRKEKAARDKLDGGSAFPSHGSMGEVEHRGMSLRDWFAGQALVGLLANVEDGPIVKQAYIFADAMLAERAKQEPKP